MTDQPWHLDLVSHEIRINEDMIKTAPTFNKTIASSPTFVAGEYYRAFALEDLSTTGYVIMPPKYDVYDWRAYVTVRLTLFNDNGTGTQGDVAAAGAAKLKFRAWSALTLGGTATNSLETEVKIEDALTAAGDETLTVSAEVSCPLLPQTTAAASSQYIHIDLSAFDLDTSGVAGLGLASGTVMDALNVRVVGYPKERSAAYSLITYRDETGIHTINKDDTFVKYFGQLVINSNDDPNFSIDAIYRDRVGSSGVYLGNLIQVLKRYSAKNHFTTDTLDQKYINLGCVNGVTDLIGIRHYLDRTASPFGETLGTPVSNPDDISFLLATLLEDTRIAVEGLDHDHLLAKAIISDMSFSTSTQTSN
jgi:hypothetical protein